MNVIQIITAAITLIGGVFFYLLERMPGTTYFIPNNFNQALVADDFGFINQALPSLIHPFAFILLTVGVLGCKTKRGILFASLFWLTLDGLLELIQHDAANQFLTPLLPAWFNKIIVLDNVRIYMEVGRFDFLDLVFITLGVTAAYFISLLTRKERNSYEQANKQTE